MCKFGIRWQSFSLTKKKSRHNGEDIAITERQISWSEREYDGGYFLFGVTVLPPTTFIHLRSPSL